MRQMMNVDLGFVGRFNRDPQGTVHDLHRQNGTTRICAEIEPSCVVYTKGGDSASAIVVILGY